MRCCLAHQLENAEIFALHVLKNSQQPRVEASMTLYVPMFRTPPPAVLCLNTVTDSASNEEKYTCVS